MSGHKIKQVYKLKQFPCQLKELQAGDLHRIEYVDRDGHSKLSDWQVAMTDGAPDKDGQVTLKSETIHFIIGRPEIYQIAAKKDGSDYTQSALTPTEIGSEQPAEGAVDEKVDIPEVH